MPVAYVGDYLPGVFYVRVSFEAGDERGCPYYAPLPEADHLSAYANFLHPTKDAAIEAFMEEQRPARIERSWWFDPSDRLPPHEEPLSEGQYICGCRINEAGEVDCLKRVAYLNISRGTVRLLEFDEDFLISWGRDYIFKTANVIDPCAPAPAM